MGINTRFPRIEMKVENKKQLESLLRGNVYISNEEIPIFSHYASLAKNTLVEIGAGLGASAVLMLVNTPSSALVHSIDSFTGDTERSFHVSEKLCRENVIRALNLIDMSKAIKRWYLYNQPSHQIASLWNKLIDFLYIDGDHRYEAVKQDFNDWFKHIKSDGVLLLHDSRRLDSVPENKFARGWSGPTKLARELENRDDLDLVDITYSLTIWRKK